MGTVILNDEYPLHAISSIIVEETYSARLLRCQQQYPDGTSLQLLSLDEQEEYLQCIVQDKNRHWRHMYGCSPNKATVSYKAVCRLIYRAYDAGFSLGYRLGSMGLDPKNKHDQSSTGLRAAYLPKSAPDKFKTSALSIVALFMRFSASEFFTRDPQTGQRLPWLCRTRKKNKKKKRCATK